MNPVAFTKRRVASVAIGLLGMAGLPGAQAAGPQDPFHPPAAVAAQPGLPAQTSTAVAATPAGLPSAWRLDGLRIGRHSLALIGGQWLAAGQRTGEATVMAVRTNGATLRLADGSQLLLSMHTEGVSSPPATQRAAAPVSR